MEISIASGKGGTGKTTIATNLAVAIARMGIDVAYLDCDVEEPNGHIFLKPEITKEIDVTVPIPRVDLDKCTLCGECSAACEYHAIAVLGKTVEVFPSLCHGCGGCRDVCPEDAIEEIPRTIGNISRGVGMGVEFIEGRLNVGEAISPPITKAMRKLDINSDVIIIDAPPGTSCPVIEAISGTDFVILVTEPTPFGLNDLKLAVGMVREVGLPCGVVINRSDIGDDRTEEYCNKEEIDILMKIPFNRQIAEAYSRGEMMFEVDPEYEKSLCELYLKIAERVNR
ncbi:MAG: (4Fe-4S)-binding protein [Candidatus Zixiibacteriota bacterium]|nr:MAG: (4Fe-4S)-binding protein [candidate division Zixibacteria bacterium]